MNISSQEGSKFKSLKIEKYYFLITILYMLVSLYSFTHLKIFEYIIMLVYLISLMLFTKFQIIYLLISFIPFFSMVSYNFLIITTLIVYLLKNYNNIVVSQKILVVISIITWEALHLFSKGTDFRQFITLAVILLLFGIVLFDKSFLHYHSKRNIGISFSISTILLSVLIILNILGSGNLEIFINNGARLGTLQYSDSILNVNPNTISLYAITSLSMLSVTDNKEIKPIVKNIFQFSLTFIGLITYSRTFIMTFILLIFIKISTYINFKRLISYIFSFFLFLLIIIKRFPNILDNLKSRFLVDDISNSRFEILELYNNFLSENPFSALVGVGSQNYQQKANIPYSIHNPIQEVIVIWGIVGLFLVLLLLIFILDKLKKSNYNNKFKFYIPLIIFLISIQTSRLFTNPFNILILMAVFLMCTVKYKKGARLR